MNCTFCDSQPETVLHLFWHCVHTRKLWQEIWQFIVNCIYNDFELFFKDVLFGIFTTEKQYGNIYFPFNLIILLAKYFIHKCKVMKVTPNFSYFQEDIKMYIKSLSTSYNKKAIKTLNVCSLFFCASCFWESHFVALFWHGGGVKGRGRVQQAWPRLPHHRLKKDAVHSWSRHNHWADACGWIVFIH